MAMTMVSAAILWPLYVLGGESARNVAGPIKHGHAPAAPDVAENLLHVAINGAAIAGIAKLFGASWGKAAAIGGGGALAIDAVVLALGYRAA